MKRLVLAALLLTAACCSRREVTVYNNSAIDRKGETVEIMLADLPMDAEGFVVTDSEGREIPSQVTYDDKLIFQADVPAMESRVYRIFAGIPSHYDTLATGAVYPQRLDDLAWESDLAAYRIYGPDLERTGERAFGNDIWVKNNTRMPIVAERYRKELEDGISYHNDNGNGYDAYSVGPTLGAGRTAVLDKDRIVYPYCYKECVILDNGPIRFTASLLYHPTAIDTMWVKERRTISIDAGSFLNHEKVWYEDLVGEHTLVTGIVVHEADGGRSFISPDSLFISHLEPTGNDRTYVAALFQEPFMGAATRPTDAYDMAPGVFGHLAAFNTKDGPEPLEYWWGASWSRSTECPMEDFDAWNAYLELFSMKLKTPLTVEIR